MSRADLFMVLSWRNHPEVRRFMLTQHEITETEHVQWFGKAASDASKYLLIAEYSGNPMGFIHFSDVTRDGVAEWGFYVAPDSPKGSGRCLGIAALNFAFHDLRLHKVCGQALDFNAPSINFHRSLGFHHEGTLREQHQIGDRYYDLYCFGLLRKEWPVEAGQ